MAYSQSELEAQYEAVHTARLRGVRSVSFSDRTTTYSSDSEMRAVEQDILAQLRMLKGRPRQTLVVPCKGF